MLGGHHHTCIPPGPEPSSLTRPQLEELDLYNQREYQLFHAVRGLLHKSASRLTTLNLRCKLRRASAR